jgi:putative transposase
MSNRGGQYLCIRYAERLAEAGAVASLGSRGDSYNNALTESVNIVAPGAGIVELAIAEWVDRWNYRRLHGAINDLPPAQAAVIPSR